MKNKYIESMFDKIDDKTLLLSNPPKLPKDIIKEYIEKLEKDNVELRQRLILSNRFGRKSQEILQEMEMKLDKYANLLSREVKVATWEYPGGIYMTPNYWKDRCENEKK